MTLAFPGQSGSLLELMAHDAFVDALADPNLRCRLLERDPEEALKVASRLEALSHSVGDADPDERWDEFGRRSNRRSEADADRKLELTRLIRELCNEKLHIKEQINDFCRRQREEVEAVQRGRREDFEAL